MATVTSASKTAISHAGKPDPALIGAATFVGTGFELVAGRRIGLDQIVDQPQEVGSFITAFCSWGDAALTSLIASPTPSIQNPASTPENRYTTGRLAECCLDNLA
jgi:hypothetical protein